MMESVKIDFFYPKSFVITFIIATVG